MAKTKVSDWSSTAASNTDVGGINIGEGMSPSDVNNAMREMMAELKNWQTGADASDQTVGGNLTVNGNATVNGNSVFGNASTDTITFNGNAISTPNNLYFDTNLLSLDSTNNRIGINTTSPAITFDVTGTDAIKLPVGTTAQRPSGAIGYLRYNSTTGSYEGYGSLGWGSIGGGAGATGGGNDKVFVENDQVITTSYTLTTGKNAMTTGTITINSGVTVTVPSGARWIIL